MVAKRTNWAMVVVAGVAAGALLLACVALAWWASGGMRRSGDQQRVPYRSNGEQIYFAATSQRGTGIDYDLRLGMMRSARLACGTCHGPDGRGGLVRMMMRSFVAPDIRYSTLTSENHGDEEEHEPFSDEDIKRAITAGVEPNGEPLDWPMPRWSMSEEDLDDLLAFLKTLD